MNNDIDLPSCAYFAVAAAFLHRTLQELASSAKTNLPWAAIGIVLCFGWPILMIIIFMIAVCERSELAHHRDFIGPV